MSTVKCTVICDIPWISSLDGSLESKHVALSIILCNKLLCLKHILYELDKHIGMTTVKLLAVKQCASTAVNVFCDVTPCHKMSGSGHFWIVTSIFRVSQSNRNSCSTD